MQNVFLSILFLLFSRDPDAGSISNLYRFVSLCIHVHVHVHLHDGLHKVLTLPENVLLAKIL